jgi:hypothetical protein
MYELSILDRKYSTAWMKRYVVVYAYNYADEPPNCYNHLIYFDDENDAKTFLVRLKLALSAIPFSSRDIQYVRGIVAAMVMNDSNALNCFDSA